jgi:hypothetical protein
MSGRSGSKSAIESRPPSAKSRHPRGSLAPKICTVAVTQYQRAKHRHQRSSAREVKFGTPGR